MKISANYLYSNPNVMNNSFHASIGAKKIASVAMLAAIAGEMPFGDSFESEDIDDDYNNVGLYGKSNLDSPQVQRFIDELA